jgi:hypothetical protein
MTITSRGKRARWGGGVLAALLGLGALAFSPPASAGGPYAGYVCWTIYDPQKTSQGDLGTVTFLITDQTNCAGNIVTKPKSLCSTGATSAACDPNRLYSEPGLISMSEKLQQASASQARVFFFTDATDKAVASIAIYGK